MKKQKPQYKIVKKAGPNDSLDRYHVYYQYFGFLWLRTHTEWTQKEAEDWIEWDKRRVERKKIKPETVGYY